jgi:hypothetical protein
MISVETRSRSLKLAAWSTETRLKTSELGWLRGEKYLIERLCFRKRSYYYQSDATRFIAAQSVTTKSRIITGKEARYRFVWTVDQLKIIRRVTRNVTLAEWMWHPAAGFKLRLAFCQNWRKGSYLKEQSALCWQYQNFLMAKGWTMLLDFWNSVLET